MKSFSTLLFLLPFAFNALAQDLSSQGYRILIENENAKQAELVWLRKHIGDFIQSCIADDEFCGATEYKAHFKRLNTYLQSSTSELIFVSEAESPIPFDVRDQTHRVAVTFLQNNAPVYINTDRINNLTIQEWLGILTHEMFHHLLYEDDAQRTLDRYGNIVQRYFVKNSQETDLGSLGSEDSRVLMYASEGIDVKILFQYKSPLSFNNKLASLDFGFNEPLEKCSANNLDLILHPRAQGFLFQPIQSTSFNPNQLRIQASSRISYACVNSDNTSSIDMSLELSFAFFLNFESVEALNLGLQQSKASFDPIKVTFDSQHFSSISQQGFFNRMLYRVESVKYNKKQYALGETIEVKATVFSAVPIDEEACLGFYTSPNFPYDLVRERFLFKNFDSCEILKDPFSKNLYNVLITSKVHDSFRSNQIKLDFVQFSVNGGSVLAYSRQPELISVDNELDIKPLRILSIEVHGDVKQTRFFNQPWTHKTEKNKKFSIEVILEGDHDIEHLATEFALWAELPGQQAYALALYMVSGVSPLFEDYVVEQLAGNKKKVTLNFEYISEYRSQKVLGIQVNRITFFTSDANFVEFISPDLMGVFFYTDSLFDHL